MHGWFIMLFHRIPSGHPLLEVILLTAEKGGKRPLLLGHLNRRYSTVFKMWRTKISILLKYGKL